MKYETFERRWRETMELTPQTVGPLTPYYKMITRRLKVMPWPWIIVLSVASIIGLYILLGSAITMVVSLLQKGF